MRKLFVSILVLALIGVCGYWQYEVNQPTRDVLGRPDAKIVWQADRTNRVISEGKAQNVSSVKSACYVWGVFSQKNIKAVKKALQQKKLFEKAIVTDRFDQDRFIAYLGPLTNQTAMRAFVKQFRQQGYRQVRAIENGAGSPGVEIASFRTEKEAYRFLSSDKIPMMKGIHVVKVLGNVQDEFDLTFTHLKDEEVKILQELQRRFKETTLESCQLH